MKHEVNWDKNITDYFIEYGKLTDEEILFMQCRCSNKTVEETIQKLHIGRTTYFRMLKTLKNKYDKVKNTHPEFNLPKRELIRETSFSFYNKEDALEMINHIDFNKSIIELKIVRKK